MKSFATVLVLALLVGLAVNKDRLPDFSASFAIAHDAQQAAEAAREAGLKPALKLRQITVVR